MSNVRAHKPVTQLIEHLEIQSAAKAVLSELAASIGPTDTERTIAKRAADLLAHSGFTETWYYNCLALVLLGSRSCDSASGRNYQPSDEPVGQFNVVTIDLSPMRRGIWGDCARTIPIEEGHYTPAPRASELMVGLKVEALLHKAVQTFATPETTFGQLFAFGNSEIRRHGFENLDYLGNLGHSIATSRDGRGYIETGNGAKLSTVPFFTFEPHVRQVNGKWGFKHEEIYYFSSEGKLSAL